MSQALVRALLLMQQLSYARILCEFHRLREVGGDAPTSIELRTATERLRDRECVWIRCLESLEYKEHSMLRVARALHLQSLLQSAPMRLAPWSDRCGIGTMPASHLFEWVSHDCERLELTQLEDAMSPQEAAVYAQSLDRLQD